MSLSLDEYKDIDPTLFILNKKNCLITKKYIQGMLKDYGVKVKIKNIHNFQIAMTHNSYLKRDSEYYKVEKVKKTMERGVKPIADPKSCIQLQDESYEELEFLGDAVIHLILADYIKHRYKGLREGFMTKLRTKIESGETLADLAKCIGLHKYALISRHIEDNDGRENNMHIQEDAFEAFMGALYEEVGFDPCHKFFINLIEEEVDFSGLNYKETNFKDRLLQYFHHRHWCDPKYGVLNVSGPEHNKKFTMYVKCKVNPRVNGEIVGTGVGSSKKNGEQEAAKKALIKFGAYKEDTDDIYEEDIEEKVEEPDQKRSLYCDICNRTFKKPYTLKRHMNKYH